MPISIDLDRLSLVTDPGGRAGTVASPLHSFLLQVRLINNGPIIAKKGARRYLPEANIPGDEPLKRAASRRKTKQNGADIAEVYFANKP
jgi:hypothetical protein